ncbi:hypothetical protein Pelo_7092 [Pelomyxa schiedti]|nr:hypothetical protein Pelo_7092 [Pelomyxa schiedti]
MGRLIPSSQPQTTTNNPHNQQPTPPTTATVATTTTSHNHRHKHHRSYESSSSESPITTTAAASSVSESALRQQQRIDRQRGMMQGRLGRVHPTMIAVIVGFLDGKGDCTPWGTRAAPSVWSSAGWGMRFVVDEWGNVSGGNRNECEKDDVIKYYIGTYIGNHLDVWSNHDVRYIADFAQGQFANIRLTHSVAGFANARGVARIQEIPSTRSASATSGSGFLPLDVFIGFASGHGCSTEWNSQLWTIPDWGMKFVVDETGNVTGGNFNENNKKRELQLYMGTFTLNPDFTYTMNIKSNLDASYSAVLTPGIMGQVTITHPTSGTSYARGTVIIKELLY